MREDRASQRCAMLLVFTGFLVIVLGLAQSIYDLLNGVVVFEMLRFFFGGVVLLLLGLMIFRCNIRKGAFDQCVGDNNREHLNR